MQDELEGGIYLDGDYHPTWGDRPDGRKLRTLDPMTVVANYIMPVRCGASNCIHETVEISANRAVHISAIGGGTIRVLQKDTATVLGIFRTSPGCARIGSIEGDNIELENVEAEIVRGKYVRIGTVEYGENLEAEHGTVRQSTQTGTK